MEGIKSFLRQCGLIFLLRCLLLQKELPDPQQVELSRVLKSRYRDYCFKLAKMVKVIVGMMG